MTRAARSAPEPPRRSARLRDRRATLRAR
jgi:hypothetical protein